QCAMQRRDQLCRVARSQHLGGNILDEQELDPVEQLGGRRFLLQSGNLADIIKDGQGLVHQLVFQIGEMYVDDALHRFAVGKADVMEKATAEKGVRQLLFVVRGDDYDRAMPSL